MLIVTFEYGRWYNTSLPNWLNGMWLGQLLLSFKAMSYENPREYNELPVGLTWWPFSLPTLVSLHLNTKLLNNAFRIKVNLNLFFPWANSKWQTSIQIGHGPFMYCMQGVISSSWYFLPVEIKWQGCCPIGGLVNWSRSTVRRLRVCPYKTTLIDVSKFPSTHNQLFLGSILVFKQWFPYEQFTIKVFNSQVSLRYSKGVHLHLYVCTINILLHLLHSHFYVSTRPKYSCASLKHPFLRIFSTKIFFCTSIATYLLDQNILLHPSHLHFYESTWPKYSFASPCIYSVEVRRLQNNVQVVEIRVRFRLQWN